MARLERNWLIGYLAMCGLLGGASFGYLAGWSLYKAGAIAVGLCLSSLGLIPILDAKETFFDRDEAIEVLRSVLLEVIVSLQQYIRQERYRQMEGFC